MSRTRYHGEPWRRELIAYLRRNRDLLAEALTRMPGALTMAPVEATYLAWLDCREAGIPGGDPYTFFLQHARVALNDGLTFGQGGEGFVRLNFGCPRATLVEGLERMRKALESLPR